MLASIFSVAASIGYPTVFLLVMAESAGIPLPGETALVTGALLASQHHLQIGLVIGLAASAAIIGDNLGYLIGRKGGRWLLERPGPFARSRRRVLEAGVPFFERHGPRAVFFGRWLIGLRTWASWLAGATGMRWASFARWNAIGGISWATTIGLAAYFAGSGAKGVIASFGIYGLVTSGLTLVTLLWRARRRRQREAAAEEGTEAPVPAARGEAPEAGVQAEAPPVAHSLRRRLITVGLLATGVLTLLLAVPGLRRVIGEIRHLGTTWVILAVALELASCLSFVVIFRRFFDTLPARHTRSVAWTEMGSGALLPGGGAGSLAIGGWLLHQAGMPVREIIRRSSGLFFLTSATNVAALTGGGLLLVSGLSPGSHALLRGGPPILVGLVGAGAAVALPMLVRRHRGWGTRWPWLAELIAGIGEAERALRHPSWRQLGALGYLGFDIAVLWATLSAVGYHPPLATLLLGYLIGYLANVIPIPGGVGVLEGGLAGALILYGAPPTKAVAGVLVYHAIAFWIPSLGGLWAYGRIRRRLAAGEPSAPDLAPASGPTRHGGRPSRPPARAPQRRPGTAAPQAAGAWRAESPRR